MFEGVPHERKAFTSVRMKIGMVIGVGWGIPHLPSGQLGQPFGSRRKGHVGHVHPITPTKVTIIPYNGYRLE
jgi:hypothetical protein